MQKFKIGDYVRVIQDGVVGFGQLGWVVEDDGSDTTPTTRSSVQKLGDLEYVKVHLDKFDFDVRYSTGCLKKASQFRSIDDE
jgi:hypothetical protein